MKPSDQPSMHWFRRRTTKWLLCVLALSLPVHAVPASTCQCARGVEASTSSQSASGEVAAMGAPACCSPKSACCSGHDETVTLSSCCGCCQQGEPSERCGCGDDCQCRLQAPTPATPALPPASSNQLGDELAKFQAVAAVASVPLARSTYPHLGSSAESIPPTKANLCATFCRFLL